MKELISAVALIVTLFGGTYLLQDLHDIIQKAALEKASQGLPSLTGFTKALRGEEKRKETQKQKERKPSTP